MLRRGLVKGVLMAGGSNGSQQAADLDFSCWIIPLYLGLFMQNGALQRIMNLYLSIVADESKFAEFVHKVADARSGGADHLGKCFLTDVGADRLRAAFLAEIREQ